MTEHKPRILRVLALGLACVVGIAFGQNNPVTAIGPATVVDDTQMGFFADRAYSTLSATLGTTDGTMTLTDASAFPNGEYWVIVCPTTECGIGATAANGETIFVTGKTGNVLTIGATGRRVGADQVGFATGGGGNPSHASGEAVVLAPAAGQMNRWAAEIASIQSKITNLAALETFFGSINLITETEIDTAAEINTLTTDDDFVTETGNHTISGTKTVTGNIDAGGGVLEIPNGAAPTTTVFGEIAGDNNAWAAGRGAPQWYDGTANTLLIGALVSDTPTNGQVLKWNTGGTITWEDDTGGGAGDAMFGDFATPTEITLATGTGTFTAIAQTIDTEADAATDDWTGATCAAGISFSVRPASDARDIVIVNASIPTPANADLTMDQDGDFALVICQTANTPEVVYFKDEAGAVVTSQIGAGGPTRVDFIEDGTAIADPVTATHVRFGIESTGKLMQTRAAGGTAKTYVTEADTQTLTNKTLTAPVISTISNTGTLTLPTATDTIVGRATTDTLTNKTLTAPVIATITNTGTVTLPTATDTLVGRTTTDTLTNKTIDGDSNTVTTQTHATDCTAATGTTVGEMCHEQDADTFWVYDGAAWDQIGAGGGGTAYHWNTYNAGFIRQAGTNLDGVSASFPTTAGNRPSSVSADGDWSVVYTLLDNTGTDFDYLVAPGRYLPSTFTGNANIAFLGQTDSTAGAAGNLLVKYEYGCVANGETNQYPPASATGTFTIAVASENNDTIIGESGVVDISAQCNASEVFFIRVGRDDSEAGDTYEDQVLFSSFSVGVEY